MERKRLIKPITILKVKNYMNAVYEKIKEGKNFSLDELARHHSISGSNGTAMLRERFILPTDIKGSYTLPDGFPGIASDYSAKELIESVRLANSKSVKSHEQNPLNIGHNIPQEVSVKLKTGEDHVLGRKSVKSPEIAPILEAIFSKISEGKQSDLFDGISNVHNERVHVASHIASAVYGYDMIHSDDSTIQITNERIMLATDDLMNRILNFKKS